MKSFGSSYQAYLIGYVTFPWVIQKTSVVIDQLFECIQKERKRKEVCDEFERM